MQSLSDVKDASVYIHKLSLCFPDSCANMFRRTYNCFDANSKYGTNYNYNSILLETKEKACYDIFWTAQKCYYFHQLFKRFLKVLNLLFVFVLH